MWYILMQTETSIECIYLTSSKHKCKKEYEKLEKEVKEEEFILYYMGYCKTGGK